jgi:hypothetical protein
LARIASARCHGRLPLVTHDIHIRTVDRFVHYPNALGYTIQDGILKVQVGEDGDNSDNIYFAPSYWQQFAIDPHSDDPLGLDDD